MTVFELREITKAPEFPTSHLLAVIPDRSWVERIITSLRLTERDAAELRRLTDASVKPLAWEMDCFVAEAQ